MFADDLLLALLIILFVGLVAGFICRRFGFSLLMGYLVAGSLVGHLEIMGHEHRDIAEMAEVGVLLLLFSIGLEMSMDDLRRLSRSFWIAGPVQMVAVAVPTGLVAMTLGFGFKAACIVGLAASLSSTVLVFKALFEQGQTETPHGQSTIAILLFQDVALVPLLLLVSMLAGREEDFGLLDSLRLLFYAGLLLAAVVAIKWSYDRWMVDYLSRLRSPELLVLCAVTLLGGLCYAGHRMGLSAAIGAFAAGIILADNRLTGQVDALILPFRETFSAIFFVSLGLLFDPMLYWSDPGRMFTALAGLLSLKVLAGFLSLRLAGLRTPAAFGMGLGLCQLGEFSFVLGLTAFDAGIFTEAQYHRLIALAFGSLLLTPLLLRVGLRWSQRAEGIEVADEPRGLSLPDRIGKAVVIGVGPVGRQVASRLEMRGFDVCLIDLSAVNLVPFAQQGFRTVQGDATDPAVLKRAHADESDVIIVSVPDDGVALRTVSAVRTLSPEADLIVRCRYESNQRAMEKAGASAVLSEERIASERMLQWISVD